MLRKIGLSLLDSCKYARLSNHSRSMCTDRFKSAYSLDKLYPNRNSDFTSSQKEKHTEEGVSTEKFSGHIPTDKLTVKYSRSSGPGGQHVNKVNTKADVRFNVATAEWLPQHIRDKIIEKKQNRINKAGELILTSERTRSQMTNFADCLQKIRDTVVEVTKKPKEPTSEDVAVARVRIEAANRERLKQKKMRSSTKRDRQVFAE